MPEPSPHNPPPDRIRAVTFDVGNTLLFPHPSLGAIYARAAARYGIAADAAASEAQFVLHWERLRREHGGLVYGTTHEQARAFWLRVLHGVFGRDGVTPEQVETLVHDLYDIFARAASWRVHPAWDRVATACRQRGLRLGIVSNWDLRLRGLLRDLGVLARVDAVAISAECGVEKPAPALFRAALDELGIAARETVHVGDTWAEDVVAAHRLGMRPVWFNPDGKQTPAAPASVPVIRDLAELLPLVGA